MRQHSPDFGAGKDHRQAFRMLRSWHLAQPANLLIENFPVRKYDKTSAAARGLATNALLTLLLLALPKARHLD